MLSAIQLYVKVLLGKDAVQEKVGNEGKIAGLRKQLAILEADIKKLQERKAMLYDKLVEEEISREGFQKSQKALTCQQEEVQYRYNELQKELAHLECIAGVEQERRRHWKEYFIQSFFSCSVLENWNTCRISRL